jgi:hypothetical protein
MQVEQNVDPKVSVVKENKGDNPSSKGKTSDIWVVLLNIFLALVTIFLLGYIAYKNGYIDLDNILKPKDSDQQEQQEETDTQEEESSSEEDTETSSFTTYEGSVLGAILPEGWTIVEYMDGDGTDMLVSDLTYTGITGLKVFNGSDAILEMIAVSGIGFVGCPELPIFPDSSEEYLEEQEGYNEVSGTDLITYDFTNTEYSDFKWFGKDFRRVDKTLYFDTVEDDEYFQPQCEGGLVTVPGLSFEDSDGYEGVAYFYGINEDATEEQLDILDSILASMVTI